VRREIEDVNYSAGIKGSRNSCSLSLSERVSRFN